MSGDKFWLEQLAPLYHRLANSFMAQFYLSGQDIRVDGKQMDLADRVSLAFATLSATEFVHLFAVFNGSRVHVQPERSISRDGAPAGLSFTVINRRLIQNGHKNKMLVFQQAHEKPTMVLTHMHIDHFFLNQHTTHRMLGTLAFALCAMTAFKTGIGKISLIAAGGVNSPSQYLGYKIWPKFGFDAPLEPGETAAANHLSGCATVQQVIARDETWWAVHGSQRRMEFDLAENSVSWKKLLIYLGEKMNSMEVL